MDWPPLMYRVTAWSYAMFAHPRNCGYNDSFEQDYIRASLWEICIHTMKGNSMHSIFAILVSQLLLAAPSFEGKWKGEIPGPGGGDKLNMVLEIKADGTAEMNVSDKDGKTFGTKAAKWKKVTDKTLELTIEGSSKPGKGELLDEKTLEIGDSDGKDKVKFTRQ